MALIKRISGGGVALAILVAALALAAGHAPGQISFAATPGTGWKLESGTVTLPTTSSGSTAFVSLPFRQTYDAPPLVFVIASQRGPQPSTVRIRNVTTAGFEAVQVEPPGMDGAHLTMTVHYLAIDPGVHVLPDGTSVEAGSVTTTTVQHGAGVAGVEGWDTLNFAASFGTTPALLAQVQDMANETGSPPGAPSFPWLTTAVRNVTTTGAELAIERSEVDDGAVASPETIGYLAIEDGALGAFLDNGGVSVAYEAIVSEAVLDGWDDGCDTVAFAGSYSAAPLVMATKSTHNEDDGGWLRRCSLGASSVGLTVDEDQDGDTERNHSNAFADGGGKVYWADIGTDKIQRANLDGSGVEDLVTSGLLAPHHMAVDVSGGKMYWADNSTAKIQRANLDGSGVEDLVTTGLVHPSGIDVDVSGGKIYWADQGTDKIQRANLDGSGVEDLVTTGLSLSADIALDVAGGKMYWADVNIDKIQRANLDGSSVEDLVTGLPFPDGVALDVDAGKMYWVDPALHKIQRANLDGSGVEDLVTALPLPIGIALDVGAGKMYWTDLGSSKIQRANLDGSGVEDLVTTGLINPTGIAVDGGSAINTTEAAGIVVFSQEFDAEFEHDLAVTKTVDNPKPNEGDTINYTVTLTNNGPTDGTGLELTDVLPPGLTYVSDTTTQGSYDSVTGAWTVGSLANGVNATLAITATVDGGAGGTTITNTAQITAADQFDPDSTNNSDSADITVTSSDLTLSKVVDNATPNQGDTASYTITITNSGPDDATGIGVSDLLPAGVTFFSDDSVGAYIPSTGVWDVGALSSGASATLIITATVDAGTGGTVITNTARIAAADQSDPDSTNNSASAGTSVNSPPNAVHDAATTDEGKSVVIDVVANDTDAEGGLDASSVRIAHAPANGTVSVNPVTGKITYTPATHFTGTDSFTYQVCDDGGLCDSAAVTVTVNSVADPPTPTSASTPGPAPSPPAAVTTSPPSTPASTSMPDDAVVQGPASPAGDAGAPGLVLPPADGTDLGLGDPSDGNAVQAFYSPPGPGFYPRLPLGSVEDGTLWWQTVWGVALIASAAFLASIAVHLLAADVPSIPVLRRSINRFRKR